MKTLAYVAVLLSVGMANPAVVVDDYYVIPADTFLIFHPLENDSDGARLSYFTSSPAGNTRLVDWDTGTVAYCPAPGFVGYDRLRYGVNGGAAKTEHGYIHIYIGITPADFTGDGRVDDDDLSILLANWGQVRTYRGGNVVGFTWRICGEIADVVDEQDLSALLSIWTPKSECASKEPE
jgi:hypothetical protein